MKRHLLRGLACTGLLMLASAAAVAAGSARSVLFPLGTLPPTTLPDGARVLRDIGYGRDPAQRLDAYLPATRTPVAVIVLVHGGGWRRGSRDNPGVAAPKAAHWLAQGIAVISVDYRMLPDADPLQQADDVAHALAYVQHQAPAWRLDPQRIVLMGHSAGAHLVALLGSDPAQLARAGARPVRGVVALDSAVLDVPALMQAPHPRLYDQAFGSDPGYWQRASPYHQLGGDAAPLLAVCSSRRSDSCPQARAYARRAAALGVAVQISPQDLSHMQINRELGGASAYTATVDAFIDRVLGTGRH